MAKAGTKTKAKPARKVAAQAKTPGRPTKYTPEMGKALCKLAETYGHIAPCARALGVTRQAVYEWRDRSDAGDPTYGDFAFDLRRAQGVWEQRELKKVVDPKWQLERFDPEAYGAKPTTTVSVTNVAPTREEALKELRELAKSDPAVAAALAGVDP